MKMRKYTAIGLALAMLAGLSACGNDSGGGSGEGREFHVVYGTTIHDDSSPLNAVLVYFVP